MRRLAGMVRRRMELLRNACLPERAADDNTLGFVSFYKYFCRFSSARASVTDY